MGVEVMVSDAANEGLAGLLKCSPILPWLQTRLVGPAVGVWVWARVKARVHARMRAKWQTIMSWFPKPVGPHAPQVQLRVLPRWDGRWLF